MEPPASAALTNLGELFGTFAVTAFRLECRQDYDVAEEAAAFRAWQEGRARPERSVRTDEYLQSVARAALAGKRWERVRVIEYPLTEYTRYELDCYPENAAAGEQVYVTEKIPAVDTDFWLFDRGHDSARAVLLRYTEAGQFRGLEAVTDPAEIRRLELVAATMRNGATPLAEFLAGRVGG